MKKYTFLTLLGFLLFFSCKKENKQSVTSVFENLSFVDSPCEEGNTGNISIEKAGGVNYRYPTFNPNNQFEFIYYKYEYDTIAELVLNPKLIKYNMLRHEKTVLLEGKELSGPVAWSNNGQLALMEHGNVTRNIYTLDDDGSNLTLQLNVVSSKIPYVKWAPDGNSFYWLYTQEISWNNKIDYLLKKEPHLPSIDTLEIATELYSMDISNENELVNFTGNGYYELLSFSKEIPSVSEFKLESGMFLNQGLAFDPNGNKFYASLTHYSEAGIYEVDLLQNKASILFKGCKAGYMQNISVSPSRRYILMEKRGLMESNHPYEIWILDLKEKQEACVISQ